jgi:hypothetical protein
MTDTLDCRRAQELFSDDADGSLNDVLRADLRAHLAACDDCRPLRDALDEVVGALRSYPLLEPSLGLAERAASAALRARRPARPLSTPAFPRALRLAAALALLLSGAALLLSGPESLPARATRRLADQAENAVFYVAERKDRAFEDVRILRVVIGAAFEGRLDRVNDRFDDYRKMIEKRRAATAPQEKKKIGKNPSNSAQASLVGRGGSGKERSTT